MLCVFLFIAAGRRRGYRLCPVSRAVSARCADWLPRTASLACQQMTLARSRRGWLRTANGQRAEFIVCARGPGRPQRRSSFNDKDVKGPLCI
mgnify:CR=1 FL=1